MSSSTVTSLTGSPDEGTRQTNGHVLIGAAVTHLRPAPTAEKVPAGDHASVARSTFTLLTLAGGTAADVLAFKTTVDILLPEQNGIEGIILVAGLTALGVGLMHGAGVVLRDAHDRGRRGVVAVVLTTIWILIGGAVFAARVAVGAQSDAGTSVADGGSVGVDSTGVTNGSLVLALLFLGAYCGTGVMAAVHAYSTRWGRLTGAWLRWRTARAEIRATRRAETEEQRAKEKAEAEKQRAKDVAARELAAAEQTRDFARAELDAADLAVAAGEQALADLGGPAEQAMQERHRLRLRAADAHASRLREEVRLVIAELLGDPASTTALTTPDQPDAHSYDARQAAGSATENGV